MHCLDVEFEDFLTYSTYQVAEQYVIFGGTRWGGSFWHHNLEMPVTRQDMTRRVSRFFGRESVSTSMPRFFVRVINSSRELNAAVRFKKTLSDALPGEQQMYMLFIIDLQTAEGARSIEGQDGQGLLFYAIPESETTSNINVGGADAFRLCSETYTRAIAFAIKHWAGDSTATNVRTFASARELSAACVQYDGGDAGRELYTPRKFYGQQMGALTEASRLQSLLAKMQTQMYMIPQGTDIGVPFPVECFGRSLRIQLPTGTVGGDVLHIYLNDGALSATISRLVQGQTPPQLNLLGNATVEEL